MLACLKITKCGKYLWALLSRRPFSGGRRVDSSGVL
jgi:hypothetical protein